MAGHEYLTHADAEDLICRTVKKTLTSMGVDVSDPMEMQRDFQALRDWRISLAAMRSKGMMTIIVMLTTGFVAALVVGIKYAATK